MALSTAASSVGRPIMAFMVQALGSVSVRAASTASGASQSPAPPKRPSSIVEPTYTYMPPGSSMREPMYFSTSDPIYFVDPKPDPQAVQAAATGEVKPKGQEGPGAPTTLPKFDFSAIAGKLKDDGRPVSYRMADDLAHQNYVINPETHSMKEPKYTSVSEPTYPPAKENSKQ